MELYNVITEFLKEKYGENLLAIILFGSYAYEGKGNDIDLIIVLKDAKNFLKESIELSVELTKKFNFNVKFDVHIFDLDNFIENLKPGTFLSGLALGYKILFDKVGMEKHIKEFLKKLSKERYFYKDFDLSKFAKIKI